MKMLKQRKFGYILILFCAFFFSSCMFNSLEEDTSGILSPDNFYKSESDLEAALMAMYKNQSRIFKHPIGQIVMMSGDDITTRPGANKQPFRDYDRFNFQSTHGWLQNWAWSWYWDTILQANNIIANIEQAEVRQEVKDEVVGQAHFIRGLSYYFLVRMFGGVPEITTPQSTGEEPRATVLEIYQLIEEDFKKAESFLPAQWPGAAGKVTSGAARTALASVYLTWAGWPLQDESKFAMAAQKAEEVMNSGVYELLDNYQDIWLAENDNNKESIFTLQYQIDANHENRYSQGYRAFEENGWNDVMAEIDFYNRFPDSERKDVTFQTNIAGNHWTDSQFGHPTYKKWTIAGERSNHRFNFSDKNIDIFRYAEVLLIYAEAQNMANGGPDASAYNAINQVRNRAGLGDLPSGLSQVEFHDAVIKERAWELAAEFSRWFDIVRNEMVDQIPQLRSDEELPLLGTPSQQQHGVALIPQVDIEMNPNLVQNPEGNKIR